MNEIKTVPTDVQDAEQRREVPAKCEVRVLDDFELVLAGGGDGEATWPR